MKKQITVFVFCTVISMATIVAGANSMIVALLMPLIFNAVYATEYVNSNGYALALTISINLAFSLIITKDLFTTFCIIPMLVVSGVLVGISAKKSLGRNIAILGGILATGGVYTAYIIYSIYVLGINPVTEMFDVMEQTLFSMTTMTQTDIDLSFVREYMALSKNLFIAIMIITFAFTGYFLAYITAFILKCFKCENQLNVTFSEFKADSVTVIVFIATIIASYLVKDGIISIALTNVYIVLNFYLAVCGASVIYYLIKYRMKAPVLVKRILGLMMLSIGLTGIFSMILVLIALWDARRDFRRLNKFEE